MKAIGGIIKAPLKALGLVPNIPKPAPAQKPISRDEARDAALREDELRRRRGSGADQVTGTGGVEAGATGRTQLG